MSGKESRVGGDPLEGTGNLAGEPDNQEREGILESQNSEVSGSSGVQSNSGHQGAVLVRVAQRTPCPRPALCDQVWSWKREQTYRKGGWFA